MGLRRGAGGPLLSSLCLGSAVLGGSCPPRGFLARAGYLPAIFRGGRAPGPGPAAPGAPVFLPLALGFRLVAPARFPGAIESGLSSRALSGSACPEARRLGGRLGPRPRGRPRRRRAWCPPAGGSTWSGAPRSAGCAGRSRGGGSPPAPDAALPPPPGPRATAAPARSRRQDSLAPVVMVTAAPVNERLSDTRAPAQPDVALGVRRSRPPLALPGLAGEQIGVKYQTEIGLGLFPSSTVALGLENKGNHTVRTASSLDTRPRTK